jgi:hypothetical protein
LRDSLLRVSVLFGVAAAIVTELLSPFHLLRRAPLAAVWLVIALAAAVYLYRHPRRLIKPPAMPTTRPFEALIVAMVAVIAALTGLAAILSPPNSADAMAYHLPRVVYWAQSGSVAFFPTPYFNQIMLQPLAEYLMLHTYVLSGGDHLVNLVAWAAFVGCIIGVSAIGGALGLDSRAQAMAALVCATLPNAILQASGAKNDMLLAFWLVAAVYFAARRDAAFTGLAVGLALATKATGYLFLPMLLGPLAVMPNRKKMAAWLAGGTLLINTPQYLRNWSLSGSPLGLDTAQGDGVFRWRNESFGWRPVLSNVLRHSSEQLGARSPRWNQSVHNAAIAFHRALNIDPGDPTTTWPGARFAPPINANHEANANNRWHLLLIVAAAILAAVTRNRGFTLYATGLLLAFLLFCGYLKWQPFLARLELPLFVLAAPVAACLLQSLRLAGLQLAVCLFLISGARSAVLENWTRPLKGPHSIFHTARNDNYFSDMVQWNNRASYLESVRRTAESGCQTVGIDISENQLEYPFQALLRQRNPHVQFVHTGVENASARYAAPNAPEPCAVLCPDCIGNQKKIGMYRPTGPPMEIGRFLLFLQTTPRALPATPNGRL